MRIEWASFFFVSLSYNDRNALSGPIVVLDEINGFAQKVKDPNGSKWFIQVLACKVEGDPPRGRRTLL